MRKKAIMVICVTISLSLSAFTAISFAPIASSQGVFEDIFEMSKTVEIPPGEMYFAYFDQDSGNIIEMELPSPEAGLSEKAKNALAQVPDWLYNDLVKKFADLAATNIDVGDYATPVFADMDGDGDLDISLGCEAGNLSYYENVGTRYRYLFTEDNSMYSSVNLNLGDSLSRTSLAIADLDGDDDKDLIIGESGGTLYYFENTGDEKSASWGNHQLLVTDEGLIDVGENSHPALADVDADDDYDLVVGAEDGNFYYYENTGDQTDPEWTERFIDPFNDLYIPQGDSRPAFADLDDDGDLDLSSGETQGILHHFENVGNESFPAFVQDDTMYLGITMPYGTSPFLSDIDGDFCFELTVGVNNGNLYYFQNIGSASNPEWKIWSSYQVTEGYMYYPKDKLLSYFRDHHANRFADLILNAPQKYKDEIGFTIAHVPTENLKAMNDNQIQLFLENAELIYEIDQYLDYVEIIEKEDYTTTRYKFGEPQNTVERELPRDIYYWYIVHPKITDENVFYVHPDDSNPNNPTDPIDGGRFWREYLFFHADESYPQDNSGAPDDGVDDYPLPGIQPPLLMDLLDGIEVLYNGTTWHAPGGNYSSFQYTGEDNRRPFDYGEHAVIRVSNWVGKTLILNQQEVSDGERPLQPVRIAHHHNGNCGELQDLTTAAARTALIPASGVLLLGEDHVWIEFYENGWHQWDNYWSDGGSIIDNWNNYWGGWGQRGGSGITKHVGDDDCWEVTGHYIPDEHLNHVTIRVMDNNGDPVDGARVIVLSYWLTVNIEGFQVDIPFPGIWNYTDANGETLFKLATQEKPNGNKNFTFRIISKVGSAESGKIELVHGQNYTFSYYLEGSAPNPMLSTNPQPNPNPPDPEYRLGISYQVTKGVQHPRNLLTGNRHPEEIPPERVPDPSIEDFNGNHIDSFITTGQEFLNFIKGYMFDSYELSENFNSNAFEFDIPDNDDWYFVLSNRDSIETTKIVELTINLYYDPPPYRVKISDPYDGSLLNLGEIVSIRGIVSNKDELTSLKLSTDGGKNWIALPWDDDIHWYYSWDTSSLFPGEYVIVVNATYQSDYDSDYIDIELLDLEPPSVVITSPSEYIRINIGTPLTITGEALDNVEITSLHISTDLGNSWTDILSNLQNDQWSYEWATTGVPPGFYLIQIQASDGSNSILVSSWEYVEISDLEPPLVSISNPQKNSKINVGTLVTISGNAEDNIGLLSLRLSTDGGENWIDILPNLDDNVWIYQWDTTGLPFGWRTLTVNGSDENSFTTFSVDVELTDTEAPLLSITSPTDGSKLNMADVITISGAATDNNDIQELLISVDGGKNWEDLTSSLSNGYWTYNWDTKELSLGMYTIVIKVFDGVNWETESIEVELADLESPVVKITSPMGDDYYDCGEIISIVGTATDNIEIIELKLSTDNGITWQDILPSLNNGDWVYNWNTYGLSGGKYFILVEASDTVNQLGTATVEINLIDTAEPQLEITHPKSDSTFDVGSIIEVRGSAHDNALISDLLISIDDGDTWLSILDSLDNGQWHYDWDTGGLGPGAYKISIKAYDGTNEVEESVTIILVEEGKRDGGSGESTTSPMLLIILILIAIAIISSIILGIIVIKRRNKGPKFVLAEEAEF